MADENTIQQTEAPAPESSGNISKDLAHAQKKKYEGPNLLLFEKYDTSGVTVNDPGHVKYINLTPTIVRLLRESGERTITIAPDVGSDRLRRVINTTETNAELLAEAD